VTSGLFTERKIPARSRDSATKSLGATIAKDVTEVQDMGWFSVIIDSTGAGFWALAAQDGQVRSV
jgi:predicted enzyme related to lactoylglutathione lyase